MYWSSPGKLAGWKQGGVQQGLGWQHLRWALSLPPLIAAKGKEERCTFFALSPTQDKEQEEHAKGLLGEGRTGLPSPHTGGCCRLATPAAPPLLTKDAGGSAGSERPTEVCKPGSKWAHQRTGSFGTPGEKGCVRDGPSGRVSYNRVTEKVWAVEEVPVGFIRSNSISFLHFPGRGSHPKGANFGLRTPVPPPRFWPSPRASAFDVQLHERTYSRGCHRSRTIGVLLTFSLSSPLPYSSFLLHNFQASEPCEPGGELGPAQTPFRGRVAVFQNSVSRLVTPG